MKVRICDPESFRKRNLREAAIRNAGELTSRFPRSQVLPGNALPRGSASQRVVAYKFTHRRQSLQDRAFPGRAWERDREVISPGLLSNIRKIYAYQPEAEARNEFFPRFRFGLVCIKFDRERYNFLQRRRRYVEPRSGVWNAPVTPTLFRLQRLALIFGARELAVADQGIPALLGALLVVGELLERLP
jgi:hypothetical protein